MSLHTVKKNICKVFNINYYFVEQSQSNLFCESLANYNISDSDKGFYVFEKYKRRHLETVKKQQNEFGYLETLGPELLA